MLFAFKYKKTKCLWCFFFDYSTQMYVN